MKIIPVIDILEGVVVRGVAGDRRNYCPIQSRLTSSTDPAIVAKALCDATCDSTIYVADLDAIMFQRPNHNTWNSLINCGFSLILDAGLRTKVDLNPAVRKASRIILALESVTSRDDFHHLAKSLDPEQCLLGIDLRQGKLVGPFAGESIETILSLAAGLGIHQTLILDVADVGTYSGGSTMAVCQQVRQRFPDWQIIAGGGVRGNHDLAEWERAGADAVLVASALHDMKLPQ